MIISDMNKVSNIILNAVKTLIKNKKHIRNNQIFYFMRNLLKCLMNSLMTNFKIIIQI